MLPTFKYWRKCDRRYVEASAVSSRKDESGSLFLTVLEDGEPVEVPATMVTFSNQPF